VARIDFGDLRQLKPISSEWGFDRGRPIDRYYIDCFLSANAQDIRGHVLEIGSNIFTKRFGGDRVTNADILHVTEGNPLATIVGDLTCADHIPSDTFDCIICTQTLHFIYAVVKALRTLCRILKPGGVLLVTTPGISQVSRYDMDRWGDYWRFTSESARRLFGETFPTQHVRVKAYGNVLTAISFLHGLASEELRQQELDHFDPDYELLIAIRATKPE
jgi:SAM-dependent methyltransferase